MKKRYIPEKAQAGRAQRGFSPMWNKGNSGIQEWRQTVGAWRWSLCPLVLPFPSLSLLGAARYPLVHQCLLKHMNFIGCSAVKTEKGSRNSLFSFSCPVGELGTMNGVLVKLFWLGATNSIELLKTKTRKMWIIGDVLYTRATEPVPESVATHWDRLSCTNVPCPDRCSSRRLWPGVRVGWPPCSGSETVLSTAAPERQEKCTQETSPNQNVSILRGATLN